MEQISGLSVYVKVTNTLISHVLMLTQGNNQEAQSLVTGKFLSNVSHVSASTGALTVLLTRECVLSLNS